MELNLKIKDGLNNHVKLREEKLSTFKKKKVSQIKDKRNGNLPI